MAKTIKFNLLCDETPVRTLEDLQNHFSIEDVLDYYNNHLLHRWLRVRGYESELKAVSAISSEDPLEIIRELIRIFHVSANEDKVEEEVYILRYLDERRALCAAYEQENYRTKQIIEDYAAGYRQLVNGIIDHPYDAALIKANIAEITSNYAWVLDLDHRNLFYQLGEKSALAIMCLLMNEQSRHYYLPIEDGGKDGTEVSLDTDTNRDKKAMYNWICEVIKSRDFASCLRGELLTFSGVTDDYWKDLEPKGKRYMIISMGNGDYVRAAGKRGGDLSSTDIQNKFVILDGVDYKSNSSYRVLRYMEV